MEKFSLLPTVVLKDQRNGKYYVEYESDICDYTFYQHKLVVTVYINEQYPTKTTYYYLKNHPHKAEFIYTVGPLTFRQLISEKRP